MYEYRARRPAGQICARSTSSTASTRWSCRRATQSAATSVWWTKTWWWRTWTSSRCASSRITSFPRVTLHWTFPLSWTPTQTNLMGVCCRSVRADSTRNGLLSRTPNSAVTMKGVQRVAVAVEVAVCRRTRRRSKATTRHISRISPSGTRNHSFSNSLRPALRQKAPRASSARAPLQQPTRRASCGRRPPPPRPAPWSDRHPSHSRANRNRTLVLQSIPDYRQ